MKLIGNRVSLALCSDSPCTHTYKGKQPDKHYKYNESTKRNVRVLADKATNALPYPDNNTQEAEYDAIDYPRKTEEQASKTSSENYNPLMKRIK